MGLRYKIGFTLSLISLAGFAESVTGRGSMVVSAILFGVGIAFILDEYIYGK